MGEDRQAARTTGSSVMIKIASFIVDKRMLFFLLYIIAILFSFFSRNWTGVENDISKYLSEETQTRQGMDLMEREFITYGSAKVMAANVTFDEAEEIKSVIEKTDGVQSVDFTDPDVPEDEFVRHYNNGSALFNVTFRYDENDDRALEALQAVKDELSSYDLYISTTLGNQQAEIIAEEMKTIIALVAVVVVLVLTLTSGSFGEVPVLGLTFLISMVLNSGTNFLFGTISFVSNSVSSILQLALSVDYAIILINHYKEDLETHDVRDAVILSLSKSIPEIMSSSLTTISGLFALVFMQFRIGQDMGTILIKAILLSLLTVFTLMPGLIVIFSGIMEKTKHRNLLPKITAVGKFAYATRHVMPILFAVLFAGAAVLSQQCPYVYGYSTLSTPILNDTQIADNMIGDNFGKDNFAAIVVPGHSYRTEARLIRSLEGRSEVRYCQGLANTEALGGYTLTDDLTPRQFSELTNMDYELIELLYSAYAAQQGEYGRIIGGTQNYRIPLMDMFLFLSEKVDEGYVNLDEDTVDMLQSASEKIRFGRNQLEGDNYDRILVYLDLPEESQETFDFLDEIHRIASNYYEGESVYVVGQSTSEMDLKTSFEKDNIIVSIVSVLFVLVILLFTFKSAGMPVLLIAIIEGAIFINFSWPTIMHRNLFFMGYLIVSSIQMGANIDYAIVISSRYVEVRKTSGRKESIIEALNFAFPTIVTSGTMMILSGFAIGRMTSEPCIVGIGECLGRGTTISVILVMFVLPQILLIGDRIIQKTAFDISRPIHMREESGTILVNGTIRGTVNGTVIGTMNAVVRGDVKAVIVSGSIENAGPADGSGEDRKLIGVNTDDTETAAPGRDDTETTAPGRDAGIEFYNI